jgi:hypothetical protein
MMNEAGCTERSVLTTVSKPTLETRK